MMRELKVPPFAPDLRADEDSRSVRLRKVGRIAIPLEQRQPLVKDRALHIDQPLEPRADLLRERPSLADEQDFFLAQFLQQLDQPLRLYVVLVLAFQRHEPRRTLREAR